LVTLAAFDQQLLHFHQIIVTLLLTAEDDKKETSNVNIFSSFASIVLSFFDLYQEAKKETRGLSLIYINLRYRTVHSTHKDIYGDAIEIPRVEGIAVSLPTF
jgi:hypothetical protein